METYQTSGVCSKEIQFEIEDNKINQLISLVDVQET